MKWREVAAVFVLGVLLASCASAPSKGPITEPRTGTYKVGKPYFINGVRYVPRENPYYSETGIASWYGQKFHGRMTANGETYDMYAMTAAHPTLPMPTTVRVTNLENGKQIDLRVNDRGPFVNGRIIDVSKQAAELLGFQRQGTAKVRVEYLGRAPLERFIAARPVTTEVERTAAKAVPTNDIEAVTLPPLPGSAPVSSAETPSVIASTEGFAEDGTVIVPVRGNPTIYIQAGSFLDPQNANRLRASLEPIGPVSVRTGMIDEQQYYRVQLGPLTDVAAADEALRELIALGHTEAKITVE